MSQADSDAALAQLRAAGLAGRRRRAAADLVVVHTCCVTAEAEHKSRRLVRRLARDGKQVLVAGCAARLRPAQFTEAGAEVLAGDEVGALSALTARPAIEAASGAAARSAALAAGTVRPAARGARRTRAVLKVQDGCGGECSYCAVRLVRGRPRSRPLDDVLRVAAQTLAGGCGEVVLSGIDLGAWQDGDLGLADLVRALLASSAFGEAGTSRLRLSSLEPRHVDEALLRALADPRVARHLHVPLQSADDEVLGAMRRPYRFAEYREMAAQARRRLGGGMLSTDVIVGFPREDEAAFTRTLAAIEEGMFGRVHVFAYSPRPGTAAAELPPLPGHVVKDRMARALAAAEAAARTARRAAIGRRAEVLVEDARDGLARGYSSEYVRYYVPGAPRAGEMVTVVGDAEHGDGLMGRVVGDQSVNGCVFGGEA